jgi:maltooligosyltrehalose trehalohydrolase
VPPRPSPGVDALLPRTDSASQNQFVSGAAEQKNMDVVDNEHHMLMLVRRWSNSNEIFTIFHFGDAKKSVAVSLPEGRWEKRLDSGEQRWQGPGSLVPEEMVSNGQVHMSLSPHAVVLFCRDTGQE